MSAITRGFHAHACFVQWILCFSHCMLCKAYLTLWHESTLHALHNNFTLYMAEWDLHIYRINIEVWDPIREFRFEGINILSLWIFKNIFVMLIIEQQQQEVLLSCYRDWHVQIHRQVKFNQDQSKSRHYTMLHTTSHTMRQNWVNTYYVFFFLLLLYICIFFFFTSFIISFWFYGFWGLVLFLVCALVVLSCGLLSCAFVILWCLWIYVHKCNISYDFHLCEVVLRFSVVIM